MDGLPASFIKIHHLICAAGSYRSVAGQGVGQYSNRNRLSFCTCPCRLSHSANDCSGLHATPSGEITVRDGVHDTAAISPIARFCTDVDDVSVTSISSGMTIEFRSDGKDDGPGFSATYEFIYGGTITQAAAGQELGRADTSGTKQPNDDNQSGKKQYRYFIKYIIH